MTARGIPLAWGRAEEGQGPVVGACTGTRGKMKRVGRPFGMRGANALGSVDSPWRVFGETGSGGIGD